MAFFSYVSHYQRLNLHFPIVFYDFPIVFYHRFPKSSFHPPVPWISMAGPRSRWVNLPAPGESRPCWGTWVTLGVRMMDIPNIGMGDP